MKAGKKTVPCTIVGWKGAGGIGCTTAGGIGVIDDGKMAQVGNAVAMLEKKQHSLRRRLEGSSYFGQLSTAIPPNGKSQTS